MKRKLPLFLLLLLGLSGCLSAPDSGLRTVRASLPDPEGGSAAEFVGSEAYRTWQQNRQAAASELATFQPQLYPFYRDVMREILSGEEKNTVLSPVNLYLALGMLSETADGATREQILSLAGCSDISQMRERAGKLFESEYADTPVCKVIPGSSFWLNGSLSVKQECLKELSSVYRADSYCGVMGSEKMNSALRDWTNEKTGNLMGDYVSGMKTEEDTAMELVSTLYLKGQWAEPFAKEATKEDVFHGAGGDETVPFLHGSETGAYYRGDNFTAIERSISDVGTMFFFLPGEGVSPQDLADDGQVMALLENPYGYDDAVRVMIREAIPKFTASSDTDLAEVLQRLGITDAFDEGRADFSALFPDAKQNSVFLSKAEHAATFAIDEQGVTGAAFTDFGISMAAAPPEEEVSFNLNRPFFFAMTGEDGSVLFVGTVYTIEAE
jgi:serine protease inhibitor